MRQFLKGRDISVYYGGERLLFLAPKIWELDLTFVAITSSFSILGHEKFVKAICIVCSFHLVKCLLSDCVLLLFRSIFLCYLASISHVSLCKYELEFTPN